MDAKPVVLKVLLQNRHLQTHRVFCREYDRVAAKADPTLRGGWPSKAQFYRWLSGELVGLPYPDHCRILECMFPDWKVDQLFQVYEGGIDFAYEPVKMAASPTVYAIPPNGSAVEITQLYRGVLDSIERGLEAPTSGQAGWRSDLLTEFRMVSPPNVIFPFAVGASESKADEAPAQRIARSLVALSKRLRLSDVEITQLAKLAGHIVELDVTCSIDIDGAGWSTVTYSHQLLNLTSRTIKRLTRELWFETTDGPPDNRARTQQ